MGEGIKASRKKQSFLAQKFEKRQQRKPEDCRMVALDRIEKMDAETFQLIGSGAAKESVIGLRREGVDERSPPGKTSTGWPGCWGTKARW